MTRIRSYHKGGHSCRIDTYTLDMARMYPHIGSYHFLVGQVSGQRSLCGSNQDVYIDLHSCNLADFPLIDYLNLVADCLYCLVSERDSFCLGNAAAGGRDCKYCIHSRTPTGIRTSDYCIHRQQRVWNLGFEHFQRLESYLDEYHIYSDRIVDHIEDCAVGHIVGHIVDHILGRSIAANTARAPRVS